MEQRGFSFRGGQSTLGAKIDNQPLLFDTKFLLDFLWLFVSNRKIYEVCWFTVYTAPSTIVVFWKVWPLHDFHWAWEGELGHGLFRSVTLWLLPFCLEIPPEWLIIETRSCHESVKEVIQDHCVMTCYPCCPRSFPLTWDETSIVDYWDRAL